MRPRTVALVVTLALGILLAPLATDAQQAARKMPRIGYLFTGLFPLEELRQGLHEFGYVEGQNIAIEYRSAEGHLDRLPTLAAELVRLKVDVIVAPGQAAVQAAKQATKTIPIVTMGGFDPVATGLVASLARPGGNITGTITLSAELIGKRLELLKETLPTVSRVAVLTSSANPASASWLKETDGAARSLGLQLQFLEVRVLSDFDSAFAAAIRERARALIELPSPIFHQNRKQIVDFAVQRRLPTLFHSRDFVDAGGLMSYGANSTDLRRRAAAYVDKILKGAKPEDLPVEQPTRFELVINLKTAKALGLTIPQSILIRADKLIE